VAGNLLGELSDSYRMLSSMLDYFASLPRGRAVLWCYLLWYLATLYFHFDPSPRLWVNSVGISGVIGIALQLSVARSSGPPPDKWQTFRLFLMPFCVSSFSSLIKDAGYWFIIPPRLVEAGAAVCVCLLFLLFVAALKWRKNSASSALRT
jgi:hypothetical protein